MATGYTYMAPPTTAGNYFSYGLQFIQYTYTVSSSFLVGNQNPVKIPHNSPMGPVDPSWGFYPTTFIVALRLTYYVPSANIYVNAATATSSFTCWSDNTNIWLLRFKTSEVLNGTSVSSNGAILTITMWYREATANG